MKVVESLDEKLVVELYIFYLKKLFFVGNLYLVFKILVRIGYIRNIRKDVVIN